MVISILRFSSRLRHFHLSDEAHGLLPHLSDLCSALSRYCPELMNIHVNKDDWSPMSRCNRVLLMISRYSSDEVSIQDGWKASMCGLVEKLAHQVEEVKIEGAYGPLELAVIDALAAEGTPQLLHLALTLCNIACSPQLLFSIRSIVETSTYLRSIYFYGIPIDHVVLEVIPSTVTSIDIKIDSEAVEALCHCLKRLSPFLETLTLRNRSEPFKSGDDRKLLSALAELERLSCLDLWNQLEGSAADSFLRPLFDRPTPSKIRDLSLSFDSITGDVVLQLLRLPEISRLNIHLTCNNLGNLEGLLQSNLASLVTEPVYLRVTGLRGAATTTCKLTSSTCTSYPE
ncbi:hypothetical protein BX666DRAFT_1879137 [Dichotomocladium elegans]|nr:hypothetical protein BX666DRAFT_1879137 [Dichotomocladium elegans]